VLTPCFGLSIIDNRQYLLVFVLVVKQKYFLPLHYYYNYYHCWLLLLGGACYSINDDMMIDDT
jgi:hypothetical protein